jgi:large conductance mechanosensitive channel
LASESPGAQESRMLKEFKMFLLRGNVVDLAVAVVIGAAFGAVVTSFVENILTPLIGMVFSVDFKNEFFTINDSVFRYGLFLNALISFILVSAAVFFLVVKPLNALAARRRTDPDEDTRDCPECLSSIPAGARRCAFCTATLSTA